MRMTPGIETESALPRERLPEITFQLAEHGNPTRDKTDGIDAARQAIWLTLHTERYLHEIYSFEYGTELAGLVGKGDSFLFPEIKRRVTEALLVDDRVTGTSNFQFARARTRVSVSFTVHTIFGDVEQSLDM